QLEAARLLEAALNGDRKAGFMLAEGISTSDLPVQLTPALNKIALAGYDNEPTIWRSFASKETVQDFGLQEWYGFTGWGDSDVEPENAGTQFISRSEERRVGKECRRGWGPYRERQNGR